MAPAEAKRIIVEALDADGYIGVGDHAVGELEADDLDMLDVHNILRCGTVEPAEWEGGEWRYRVKTNRMAVVVAFDEDAPPPRIFLVTAWRERAQ